ncbi:MAG: hypothetical protein OEZ10_07665 [Gammaproteobacteria bacterium]|nr:hypothetical protein [Gammaproteobacteria bacterium]
MDMRQYFGRRLLLMWLVLFMPGSWAAVSHTAGHEWKVLVTPHFKVHYHDGLEELAIKAARIAEDVHDRYSKILKWEPGGRTNMILTDEIGLSNGWSTPVPDNREAIYVTPPTEPNSLEDHGGWLETVITHEYIHTLHLDKASGFPKFMRYVIGRYPSFFPFSVFPNAFQPSWVVEGLATYYETDRERGIGRGQSSYFGMMMRMEVLEGIKSYRQANWYTVDWPTGTIPYLYGVHFFDFLAETKGKDAVVKMVEDYSDDGLAFRVNANMGAVFGKNINGVWRDFEAYLKKRYMPQIEGLQKSGLVEGQRLTAHGYDTGNARLLDGDLYYIRSDDMRRPALMKLGKGEQQASHLADVHFYATFDIHPKVGILLAQPEFCGNAQLFYDLYQVNPDSGRTRRLTSCGQYHAASWHPDGERIAAARVHNGKSSLVLMNAHGDKDSAETLWQASDDTVIGQLDWSPDGNLIVASVWRPENGWDLEEFAVSDRTWKRITKQQSIEMHPQYSADGKSIIYSADYNDVYNIHSLDVASGKITTLTNVLGGAFSPVLADDGSLYFTGYHAGGQDIYRVENAASSATKAVVAKAGPSAKVRTDWPELGETETKDYWPWSTLYPRWWMPYENVSDRLAEMGVMTSGTDVLNRHIYSGLLAWDVQNDWAVGSVDYIYDRWWPTFKYHASRYSTSYLNLDSETQRIRLNDVYQAELVFPWLSLDRRLTTHLGYVHLKESDGWINETAGIDGEPDDEDSLAGLAFVYNSSKWFSRSISRNDGRQINLVYENSNLVDDDNYSGELYLLDWREFWPLWGEHVLALRFAGARSTEWPVPFRLGGSIGAGGTSYLLDSTLVNSPFAQRRYGLRGYPSGLAWLTGRNMHLGSAEYRFPVVRIERGSTMPPIGISQIHGTLFVDYGAAWNSEQEVATEYFTGAGVEGHFEITAFYSGVLDLRVGYAHGFDLGGEDQVYLGVGASF